jgi:pSer/pThr/pTyr-binding forkhead associated (FHA) protein
MDGPTYRHVQLPAQTVSRMHARMRFEGGRWQISNLSPTNPVVVNGEPLDADGESRLLAEGDRVELGEVVLRFRERA